MDGQKDYKNHGMLEPVNIKYKWKIAKIVEACNLQPSYHLESPTLFQHFHLKFYPQSDRLDSQEYVSVFLRNDSNEKMALSVKLSIVNAKDKVLRKLSFRHEFEPHQSWGIIKFIERSILLDPLNINYCQNGVLILQCEIDHQPFVSDGLECYEKFYNNANHTDVTFTIGRSKIQAHKIVLMARSSVFEDMFSSNVKENIENVVKVLDIKVGVLKELLRFMYCNQVENIKDIAMDLFLAADKYAVNSLKSLCERTLIDNITQKNAFQYLKFADTYNLVALKDESFQFITTNMKDIVKKPEFEEFSGLSVHLMREVLVKVLK